MTVLPHFHTTRMSQPPCTTCAWKLANACQRRQRRSAACGTRSPSRLIEWPPLWVPAKTRGERKDCSRARPRAGNREAVRARLTASAALGCADAAGWPRGRLDPLAGWPGRGWRCAEGDGDARGAPTEARQQRVVRRWRARSAAKPRRAGENEACAGRARRKLTGPRVDVRGVSKSATVDVKFGRQSPETCHNWHGGEVRTFSRIGYKEWGSAVGSREASWK